MKGISLTTITSPAPSRTSPEPYSGSFEDKFQHVVATEISASDEQSQGSVEDDAPIKVSKSSRAFMTAIFCLCMMSNGLDFNVLGDASPYVAAEFNVFDKINWMSTATLLAALSSLLLTSKAMNFVEIKYFMLTGLLIMAIGETLAGVSPSFGVLIIGRVCSGLAAPVILVVGTTVTGMIWNSQMRPLMISIILACYGIMIKIGPLVAGALLKRSISLWRWCFYLQIPFLGLLFLATILFFPRIGVIEPRSITSVLRKSTLPGLCQAGAFVCIVFPLVAGGTSEIYRWTGPSLIFCYVAAPLLTGVFAYLEVQNAEEDRFLPWEAMLADRSVALMGVVTFCSMFTIFSATFYLPIMYQLVFKSSPIHAAVQLLPNAVAGTIATVVVGKVIEKTGHFIPSCIVCSVFQIIGGGLCSQFSPTTPNWKLYLFTAIGGIGAGGTASIGTPFTLEKTSLKRYGAGTALSNLCLLFGAAIGVSSTGIVIAHQIESIVPEINKLEPSLDLGPNVWKSLILIYTGSEAVQGVFRKAFMRAMDIGGIMYAVVGAISLFASFGLKWQKMHHHGAPRASQV